MSFLQKTLDFEEALYLNKIPICRSPCCHRVGRALWTGEGRVSDDLLSQAVGNGNARYLDLLHVHLDLDILIILL